MVVVGVVGEWRFGAKLEDAQKAIHTYDLEKITAADEKAGSAADSAARAQNRVGALTIEADAIQKRLDSASQHLSGVEAGLLNQGPRALILDHWAAQIITALTPFAGQEITVTICGEDDPERWEFEQKLMDLVRKANWATPDYKTWRGCPKMLSSGNEIFAASNVQLRQHAVPYSCRGTHDIAGRQGTGAAAETLCDVLTKIHINTIAFMEAPIDQKVFPMESPPVNQLPVAVWARGFFGSGIADSPARTRRRRTNENLLSCWPTLNFCMWTT